MPRRRHLGAGLAGVIGALALAVSPAVAMDAGTITHAAGDTSATLAWDGADFGITNPRLTITRRARNGKRHTDRPQSQDQVPQRRV